RHHGRRYELHTVPQDEEPVYEMLSRADTIGVFQVESRAQMSMLPRLRPREFYDLVIEVAIVRPGPIQGKMVHPYLRRRDGKEKVEYPSSALKEVLHKTLGVPLFQEQAMRIAMVAAGFSASEADQLRRAMATFRNVGTIRNFRTKMVEGMVANGYGRDFAERCFDQIEGFGSYGFPESHAASFALLVYVSAWLKCRYPAVFACALLNSQPMGFYAPAQIVRDARDHGVEVRPVDVNRSDWDCTLEDGGTVLRLGFRQVKGLSRKDADALVAARGGGYADPEAAWRRSGLDATVLDVLAQADAFGSMGLGRRQALWAVRRLDQSPLPLFSPAAGELGREPAVTLPGASVGEEVLDDYDRLRLTLKSHPLALLRPSLARRGAAPNRGLAELRSGMAVTVAGLVLIRQRPGTAKGVTFMTLEDETGIANIVVWSRVFDRFRRTILRAELVAVEGRVQREGEVIHVVADRIADLTGLLRRLRSAPPTVANDGPPLHAKRLLVKSRDFH
ncbi:MAG TPA: OB-fold nucleic acid binding domain-containing protein, partial [Alphaproteobacteria bacterium]|nr:OB-fold nucleic acid binding domain-containing protein [Alphaproteobacteria bacterium]